MTTTTLGERSHHASGVAEVIGAKRDDVLRLAARHGATDVRIFGSVARGEAGQDSDIDLLVVTEQGRSLLDISRLCLDMADLLGRRVDVAEVGSLHWAIRDRVLREARLL